MSAPPTQTPSEYTYDHYPKMTELLQTGGSPGITYLGVHPNNLAAFQHGTHPLAEGFRWGIIESAPSFYVEGPDGTSEVFLVGAGTVITQADPMNGIRKILYDEDIEVMTGLERPRENLFPGQEPTKPVKAQRPTKSASESATT